MKKPLVVFLCPLIITACGGAFGAGITGLASSGGTLQLSDAQGTVLTLTPAAWGPKFAWTGLKGKLANENGKTVGQLTGTLNGTGVPFAIAMSAGPSGARSLQVTAELTAERESSLTLVTLVVGAGERFRGTGRCTVGDEGGETTRDVPFGRGPVGSAVRSLRFRDGGTAAVEITFAEPVVVEADGEARIVLAAKQLAAGERRRVSFTVSLPEDLTWYPTPNEVPFPSDWDRWFAWQPTAALTSAPPAATGISMAGWNREPAGAQGRVVRQGDRLLVGGKPTKFWGLNDCYANCAPDKALADRRAALYAKMGVNAVRLHKFAEGSGWAGILSKESFAEFDPAALDRMDYFVSALKAKGIYVKLSAHFGNVIPGPADAASIPWLDDFADGKRGKRKAGRPAPGNGGIYVAQELQELQFRQTTNLLKHRNPYTGLTYAEDPAVLAIEEFNENSALFFGTVVVLQKSPALRARMAERFTDWLAKRYGDEAGLAKAWGPGWKDAMADQGFRGESFAARSIVPAGNPWYYDPDQLAGTQAPKKARLMDTMRFLYELQNDFYQRYAEVMRSAGYTGEILASNWHAGRAFSHYYNLHSDSLVGLIDRHNYFGGKTTSNSMLTRAGSGMLSSGTCQVADRPFMLSEWIHTFPNEYGAEGPAILGAYGLGLQDWDVSFMFQNGDEGGFVDELGTTWAVTAPQVLGLFPAVARQVRRGDVLPASAIATRNVHVPSLADGRLGFDDQGKAAGDVKEADSATIPARSLAVARHAVAFADEFKATPAFDLAPFEKDGALVSSTGQLRWIEGAQPHLVIDTPGTQAVVGWSKDKTYPLADVEITSRTPFAVLYVSAADEGESIRSAKRLLVTTLARARNTGMKIAGNQLLAKGGAPILIEPVQVEVVFKRPGNPMVYACDPDGNRTATVIPLQDGKLVLDSAKTKTIWYEIVYE